MMKKTIAFLFVYFAIFGFIPKAEAFLDLFVVHGKRNNTINKIILESLNTDKTKWYRSQLPFTKDYTTESIYLLEAERNTDVKRSFSLAEFNYKNHPTLHSLKDIFAKEKDLGEKLKSHQPVTYRSGNGVIEKDRILQDISIIFQNENSIGYEMGIFDVKQKGKVSVTENLFGEREEKEILSENEERKLRFCDIRWVVDIGNSNFRSYNFRIKDRLPTPEEKKYLLDLFQYMEAQIQNVK